MRPELGHFRGPTPEVSAPDGTGWSVRAAALVKLMRPHQWPKNALCLAGVLFGPNRLLDLRAWGLGVLTVVIFSALSSAVYILNDIADRERDRKHPKKRARPLANGDVAVPVALALALALTGVSLGAAAMLDWRLLVCLVLYLANNAAYSARLKHVALFDVLCIALGFVLRLLAGVYVLGDLPTTWITLCTFFLSMFLGFAKRRGELAGLIAGEDSARRPVLSGYTVQFLDYLVNSSAVMAVICYALFTTTSGKNPTLVVTVPIVFLAVMHYKRLVMLMDFGEEPESILLHDPYTKVCIVSWLVCYFAVVQGEIHLFR